MAPYASVTAEWPPWLASQHRSNLVNGKRKAEDELESQSNISSQFKKLRLNHGASIPHAHPHSPTLVPIPIAPPSSPSSRPSSPTIPTAVAFRPHIPYTDARPALQLAVDPDQDEEQLSPPPPPLIHKPPTLGDSDFMPVDDTPNRIVIHDLSAEIAAIEAEETAAAATMFLPDIDRKVSSLPHKLLGGRSPHSSPRQPLSPPSRPGPPTENLNTALVLYKDPSSISVSEEEDAVRKTIIAARMRARERQAEEQRREQEREAAMVQARTLDVEWDDAMTDHSTPRADEDIDLMDIE